MLVTGAQVEAKVGQLRAVQVCVTDHALGLHSETVAWMSSTLLLSCADRLHTDILMFRYFSKNPKKLSVCEFDGVWGETWCLSLRLRSNRNLGLGVKLLMISDI